MKVGDRVWAKRDLFLGLYEKATVRRVVDMSPVVGVIFDGQKLPPDESIWRYARPFNALEKLAEL